MIASIDNRDVPLALPLDIRGTAFQQRVWQALRNIPCGETASYRQVAQAIGQPSAVRAVAGACAAKHAGDCDPLSSRGSERRRAVGLPLGLGAKGAITET